jgi:hypothetical protein
LSAKNAAAFGKQLAPYLEHARRAGRAPSRRSGRTAAGRQRSGDIRAWAKEHGLPAWWSNTRRPAGDNVSHHRQRGPRNLVWRAVAVPSAASRAGRGRLLPLTSPVQSTCAGTRYRPLGGK